MNYQREKYYIYILLLITLGERIVSLEFAQKLKEQNVDVIPGSKLCRSCYKLLTTDKETEVAEEMNTDEETMQVQGSNEQKFSTPPSKKMNRSFSSVGISPVSFFACFTTTQEGIKCQ